MAIKIANWQEYSQKTDSIEYLRRHRDWVEQNKWGYGDRALHYMWYELLKDLPKGARLLEIGVYRGQTLSLWRLIGKRLHKRFQVYGVTPLDTTGDKYSTHEAHDYPLSIEQIHNKFNVRQPIIIKGVSVDVFEQAPDDLDLLFIDGGHDRETVEQDIANYAPKVKKGGLLVFDDAGCNLEDFGHWYKGLPDVSDVVDEFARNKSYGFEEILRLGYVRVFRYAN